MKKIIGFTLPELLIVLSISAILFGIALPSFKKIIEDNQIKTNMHTLHKVFAFARSTALETKQNIVICGSNSDKACDKFWTKNLVVFIDENDDKEPGADEIIHIKSFDLTNGKFKSRMSAGRPYTKFLANGMTSGGGTVIYCPEDKEASKYRRMTWNRVGRTYRGSDSDGDGIYEDYDGKMLNCN